MGSGKHASTDHPSSEFHMKFQGWVAHLSLMSTSQRSASLITVFHSSGHESSPLGSRHSPEHSGSSGYCQEVTLDFQWCLLYMTIGFFSYKFPLNMDIFFSGHLFPSPHWEGEPIFSCLLPQNSLYFSSSELQWLILTGRLLWARHCSECFTGSISYNVDSGLVKQLLLFDPHFEDERREAQRGDPNFPRATQSESGRARIQAQPVLSTNKLFCLAPFPASTGIHFTFLYRLRISFPLWMLPSPSNVMSISPLRTPPKP